MNPGDVIADRFVIEFHRASGGMGAVYRAVDRHTDGLAAVKVVRAADADAVERFAREARALAELLHPHIVRYLAHGRTAGGNLYLAMEWLSLSTKGLSLGTWRLSIDLGDGADRSVAISLSR